MGREGRDMIKNENRIYKSGTDRVNSADYRMPDRRKWVLIAGFFLAVLVLTAGFGCMRAYAGTSKKKTKTVVITADTDDRFAAESAKLAKKSRGMLEHSTGKAKAYSSGRLIVCLQDGKSVDFSKYKATTVIKSNFGVCLVQFSSRSAAKKAAKKIAALPAVSYVEPDDCSVNIGDTKVGQISLEGSTPESGSDDSENSKPEITAIEKDSSSRNNVGLTGDLVYQDTVKTEAAAVSSNAMSWGAAYIQADKYAAFVKSRTKRTIKVAVIDSGVSYHNKLKGRILTGKDYVDNDSNPSDKNGHGTHVAGVIVDCTPGINVKILPVRVINAYGNGNPSSVGNGIRYAVNKGAKVINLSLGAYQHYKYIESCINYANKKGATVVVAAGNECGNTKYVCPAHMSAPIVVGAINANGKRASFSNYGSSLDISAPGVNIRSCWLKGKYATASGTSMAVPHISAAAAMYRLMNPSAKPSRIQSIVRSYAKDLGAKGTDRYYGRGVPRMAGAITPNKVTLPKKALYLQVKSSVTLKAAITPSYAGKKKLTWTSSNKKVATVSGGKIIAKKKGTTIITVKTVNGKKATCKVTVTAAAVKTASVKTTQTTAKKTAAASPAPVVSAPLQSARTAESARTAQSARAAAVPEEVKIYIYPSDRAGNSPVQDGSIVAGSRLALDAEIVPTQGDLAVLKWNSSNPEIASVDENGIVTAVSAGEAQITAVLSSGENDLPSAVQENNTAGEAAPAVQEKKTAGETAPAVQENKTAGETAPAELGNETAGETAPAVQGNDPAGEMTPAVQENETVGEAAPADNAADSGTTDAVHTSDTADTVKPVDNTGMISTGTYTVKVVDPSVLTRHASYSAGEDKEVNLETVLRVPASLSDQTGGEAERINPRQEYVLAILSKEDKDLTLLGAVNLGGDDSGTVHVHDSEDNRERTDLKEIREVSEDTLAALSSGKQDDETGILSMHSLNPDGCKADVSLTANIDALRAASGPGREEGEKLTDCVLAVYTDAAFEKREAAAEKKDVKTIRQIDEEAVCKCSFSLSYILPDKEAEESADPADKIDDPVRSGDGSGTDSGSDKAEPVKSPEDHTDHSRDSSEADKAQSGADTASDKVSDEPEETLPAADKDKEETKEVESVGEENESAVTDEETGKEESHSAAEGQEQSIQEEAAPAKDTAGSQEQESSAAAETDLQAAEE